MAQIVIVPGGWHSGAELSGIAKDLQARGHAVFTPTLTGLGDRAHLAAVHPNLDTHIHDIANLIEIENLTEVVLCGHSYAGMVITGVADLLPERIAALVYIDALVPADGQSWWDLMNPYFRDVVINGISDDGRSVVPPAGMDSRCRPHPLASFLQRIRLTGRWNEVPEKLYIHATAWDNSPFAPTVERLRQLPGWRVEELAVRHNIIAAEPEQFLQLLESLRACRGEPSTRTELSNVP